MNLNHFNWQGLEGRGEEWLQGLSFPFFSFLSIPNEFLWLNIKLSHSLCWRSSVRWWRRREEEEKKNLPSSPYLSAPPSSFSFLYFLLHKAPWIPPRKGLGCFWIITSTLWRLWTTLTRLGSCFTSSCPFDFFLSLLFFLFWLFLFLSFSSPGPDLSLSRIKKKPLRLCLSCGRRLTLWTKRWWRCWTGELWSP